MRDLPPGLPEPTDESVSRTWYRITAAGRPARTRTPSRILVPAMAATLVAGLVVGGALLFRPGAGPMGFGAPSGETPSEEKTSEPNLTPASPETVAVLQKLAEAAASSPAAAKVRPGQYIFVRHDGWAASFRANAGGGAKSDGSGTEATPQEATLGEGTLEPQIREMWFDPQGMIAESITDGSDEMGVDPDRTRAMFEQDGPSFRQPTPEWVAGLPTDPEQLLAELRDFVGEGGAWSTDHAVWSTMQEFYLNTDLLLGPELRAALLRSFAGLRGITFSDVSIDGRQLVAVRHTERGNGDEILFDLATGVAVGRRSVAAGSGVTISAPPEAPKLDPGVGYQATWTQKVVDAVGDR
ncbi:hypothetical protein GCM10022251_45990 [Phytohabitans flavus]